MWNLNSELLANNGFYIAFFFFVCVRESVGNNAPISSYKGCFWLKKTCLVCISVLFVEFSFTVELSIEFYWIFGISRILFDII